MTNMKCLSLSLLIDFTLKSIFIGAVRTMVAVTLEVTQYSWRLLGTPGGCSSIPGVFWACSQRGCLLGDVPTEFAA